MVHTPIRLAILNDYQVVVEGLVRMLAAFPDRVEVIEAAADAPLVDGTQSQIDIVLYDAFAARARDETWHDLLGSGWLPRQVVIYTWDSDIRALPPTTQLVLNGGLGDVRREGREGGLSLHLSKNLDGEALVTALEEIHTTGTYRHPPGAAADGAALTTSGAATDAEVLTERDWPGKTDGLSERESEIVALVTQGLSNQDLADRLYLSINTVKSYIRTAYRKMDVTSRSKAVLWGVDHGFQRPRARASTPSPFSLRLDDE